MKLAPWNFGEVTTQEHCIDPGIMEMMTDCFIKFTRKIKTRHSTFCSRTRGTPWDLFQHQIDRFWLESKIVDQSRPNYPLVWRTLMHASSTMGLKFTATIEGGSRHENIVNLGEFLRGILIRTSDHHLLFVEKTSFSTPSHHHNLWVECALLTGN